MATAWGCLFSTRNERPVVPSGKVVVLRNAPIQLTCLCASVMSSVTTVARADLVLSRGSADAPQAMLGSRLISGTAEGAGVGWARVDLGRLASPFELGLGSPFTAESITAGAPRRDSGATELPRAVFSRSRVGSGSIALALSAVLGMGGLAACRYPKLAVAGDGISLDSLHRSFGNGFEPLGELLLPEARPRSLPMSAGVRSVTAEAALRAEWIASAHGSRAPPPTVNQLDRFIVRFYDYLD